MFYPRDWGHRFYCNTFLEHNLHINRIPWLSLTREQKTRVPLLFWKRIVQVLVSSSRSSFKTWSLRLMCSHKQPGDLFPCSMDHRLWFKQMKSKQPYIDARRSLVSSTKKTKLFDRDVTRKMRRRNGADLNGLFLQSSNLRQI